MNTMYRLNDPGLITGTFRQGCIETDYDSLVRIFGNPEEGGDKTTAEWWLEFINQETGRITVATIYDWKYEFTPKQKATWTVGGHTRESFLLVQERLNLNKGH